MSSSRPNYENIIKLKMKKNCENDSALANMVVTCQILLLRAAQKSSNKVVSNLVVANSLKDENGGPAIWANQLPEDLRDQKLLLVGKLVLSLSNNASLITAMHMRTAAIKIIPQAENQYYSMLLSSFEAIRKQKSEADVVKQFGNDIIYIAEKHENSRNSEEFLKLLNCVRPSKNVKVNDDTNTNNNTPEKENAEDETESVKSVPSSRSVSNGSIKGAITATTKVSKTINEVTKRITNFGTDITTDHLQESIADLLVYEHFESAVVHKSFYILCEKLIKDTRFDLFSVIVQCYVDTKAPLYKYPGKLLELFLTTLKSTLPPNEIALNIFNQFVLIMKQFESWDILVHISNSMLNTGARYKQKNQQFLPFWAKSLEIELDCYGKAEKNMLAVKGEKLALGYYCKGLANDAVRTLTCTLKKVDEHYNKDEISKLVTVLSRILLDFSDIGLDWDMDNKLTADILERVMNTILKSSNPARINLSHKIIDKIWNTDYELKKLGLAHLHFKITGELYEPVLTVNIENDSNHDMNNKYYKQPLIKAYTLMDICITHRYPERHLFHFLTLCVDYFCESLHLENVELLIPTIDNLIEFLDLQGTHELRTRILKSVLNASSLKQQLSGSRYAFYHRELAFSQLQLGYSGAAHKEVLQAKKYKKEITAIEWAETLMIECEYYTEIDSNEDARKSLTNFNTYIQSKPELAGVIINGKIAKESSSHFQRRVLLYARSTLVFSKLHLFDGQGDIAAVNSQRSVRFLQGFMKRGPPKLYPVISLLLECMIQTAKMFEKVGVVREAGYYSQEAAKLAESTLCPLRLTSILSFEGEMKVRMGKFDNAKELLWKCEELMEGVDVKDVNFLQLVHSLALYLQRQCMFSEETVYYDVSEQAYSELIAKSGVDELTEGVAKLKVSKTNKNEPAAVSQSETLGLDIVHNTILRSKVYSLGLQDAVDGAMEVLDGHYKVVAEGRESVLLDVSKSRNYYLMAKKLLTLDPVFNVIQDSALSIPSANLTSSKQKAATTNTKSKKKSPSGTYGDAVYYLIEAKDYLIKNQELMLTTCSSIEISDISNLLNNVTIMLNAVSKAQDIVSSMLNFSLLEMSKGYSSLKDRSAMTLKKGEYEWPVYEKIHNSINNNNMEFEKEFLNAIPENWLVLSINVAPDTDNLIISRYTNGNQPFMISLPLNRHSSRDADEDSFSLDDGLQQLDQIINASNASAHASRTSKIKTKEDRQEWWEERFALDKQLQSLLHDVEYCWLGGFRGLFNTVNPEPSNAAKFREQFDQILQSHLPSRYKRKSNQNKVGIHDKIYELFMGLGNINDEEEEEYGDPGLLEDLIYFVLDILQFHGEQNAYDELDMDQMVVEMEECIKGYYSRMEVGGEQKKKKTFDHTVLVLDKKSRQFPWESIPLLRKKSVTRVPSLQVFMEALKSQDNNKPVGRDCYYLLNPGRDLLKTQERFQNVFENLSTWDGKSGEAPTEDEMANALENKDLVVYMGHGGGEQYIRSAKIKSLKRCAPTLLLGCSSGALEYVGDYESWGTPLNYLIAGCPMLIANMWDVTDKDTDKFSIRLLEKWGVLADPGDKTVDIAKAVMQCRDECTLRYLNGSATVVYGLPLRYCK